MSENCKIPKFKIMCSECEHQIKNNEIEFEEALYYKFVRCPNCKSINLHLVKEK